MFRTGVANVSKTVRFTEQQWERHRKLIGYEYTRTWADVIELALQILHEKATGWKATRGNLDLNQYRESGFASSNGISLTPAELPELVPTPAELPELVPTPAELPEVEPTPANTPANTPAKKAPAKKAPAKKAPAKKVTSRKVVKRDK